MSDPTGAQHLALALIGAIFLVDCSAAAVEAGADEGPPRTPEELVLRLQAAERGERYADVLGLIPPDAREEAVFMCWYGAAYDAIGADPDAAEDYRAVVTEHGLDERFLSERTSGRDALRRLAAEALRGVDQAALFGELAEFRVEHGRFGQAFGTLGELRGIAVEGDRATAEVGESSLELVRLEGVWFWQLLPTEEC